MEKAIRLISVERGHDPREFTLVCFGGAGPLHACSLARGLGIPRVLVPAMPGALSALGILMSDAVRDYSRTVMISWSKAFNRKDRQEFAKDAEKTAEQLSKAFNRRDRRGTAEDGEKTEDNFTSLLETHFSELEGRAAAEFRGEGLSVGSRSGNDRHPHGCGVQRSGGGQGNEGETGGVLGMIVPIEGGRACDDVCVRQYWGVAVGRKNSGPPQAAGRGVAHRRSVAPRERRPPSRRLR